MGLAMVSFDASDTSHLDTSIDPCVVTRAFRLWPHIEQLYQRRVIQVRLLPFEDRHVSQPHFPAVVNF